MNVEWADNPENTNIIVDFEIQASVRDKVDQENKWIVPGAGPNGTTRGNISFYGQEKKWEYF